MGARQMAPASSSYGARLLIALVIIVSAGLSVHAFLSFQSTKEQLLEFVALSAERASGLIERATHDAMLLHRFGDLQKRIEWLAHEPGIAGIHLYDKRGRVVLSSDSMRIGRRVHSALPPCTTCHRSDERPLPQARSVTGGVMRQLTAITTEPGCRAGGCHDLREDQKVLGVLAVDMSMAPVERALDEARSYLVWTTIALAVVIALIAALTGRRLWRYRHLEEWSQLLEEKVAEETAELHAAQRQVVHMEKMASMGKLSATVAHELNNPISGMLTYVRLVERELVDQPLAGDVRDEINRYLQLVQRECVRCGNIVRNLLAFSRRSTGDTAQVDLNEVVERSVMLIQHHTEMEGITVRTRPLPSEDRHIVADAGEIEQALVALMVNALEAMQRGGRLEVTLTGDSERVAIDISDTGAGIPAEILPLIFEPFYSTKTNETGSGLGLAVVYGIVHRHGGTISVDSEVGVGTRFHITLPRAPAAPHSANEALQAAGATS